MPTQAQKNSITAGMMIHGDALPSVCVGIDSQQQIERQMIQKGMFMHGDAFPSRPMKKLPDDVPTLEEITARLLALRKKIEDLKSQQAGGGE